MPLIVFGSHHLPSTPSSLKIQIPRLPGRTMSPDPCPADQNDVFDSSWQRRMPKTPANMFPANMAWMAFHVMTWDWLQHHYLEHIIRTSPFLGSKSLRLEQPLKLAISHRVHLSHLFVDINLRIIQIPAFYVVLGGGQIVSGPFNIPCLVGLDDRKTEEGNVQIELRRLIVTEDIPGLIMVVREFAIVLFWSTAGISVRTLANSLANCRGGSTYSCTLGKIESNSRANLGIGTLLRRTCCGGLTKGTINMTPSPFSLSVGSSNILQLAIPASQIKAIPALIIRIIPAGVFRNFFPRTTWLKFFMVLKELLVFRHLGDDEPG